MTALLQTGPLSFDVDARDAQVMSNPRIGPLRNEEFSEEARALVEATRAQFGTIDTDEVPFMFGVMFKHPGLFRSQMQLGVELAGKGYIPARERELIVLRVAWLSRSPFEWGEHVEPGKRLGLTVEDIERITQGSDAPDWGEHDRAILRAVEELMGDYAVSDATWEVLAKRWTEPQLIELPGLVGAYVMTALIYNTLRFEPLEGNPGLRRR